MPPATRPLISTTKRTDEPPRRGSSSITVTGSCSPTTALLTAQPRSRATQGIFWATRPKLDTVARQRRAFHGGDRFAVCRHHWLRSARPGRAVQARGEYRGKRIHARHQDGVAATLDELPRRAGSGGNDHGRFRSQFGYKR